MLNTLNRKLSLALLIIVSGVGFTALIISRLGICLYYEELTQKLNQDIAMYVTSAHELIQGDVGSEQAIKLLAQQAMVINPAVEVYLLDTQGKVLQHALNAGELVRKQIDVRPLQDFIRGDELYPIRAEDPRHASSEKIFSAAEIRSGQKLLGYFYVVLGGKLYDELSENLAWSYIGKQMLGYFLIIATAIALIGLFIFRMLSQPLIKLTSDISQFAKTELGEDSLHSLSHDHQKDEVSHLNAVFQIMSRKITEQLEQLRTTDRLRRELVSNVSHDLRTPLATMQGYLETLIIKDQALTGQQRIDYLRSAEKGCHRLSSLISDLFELSKLESGSKKPTLEYFPLVELMYDTAQSFKLELKQKDITLSISSDENKTCVHADIGMIQRVFDNLIKNAITHTPQSGSIRIHMGMSHKGILVTVEDTGRGICKEDLPRVFNRFYQSSLSSQKRIKASEGLGLGLAIVKKILELHGSDIKVTSQIRKGTRFQFTLPA